ncbi:MAG: hypothetical protein ACFFDH_20270 [Promethearchaeota archaeon]
MALEVLNDPKYDTCKYVDKNEIEKTFDEYGYKLNPFNSNTYNTIMTSPHIEGYFFKVNLPEIESIVYDEVCDVNYLEKVVNEHPDITHFALSTYAMGMDKTIKVIKAMKLNYPDKEILLGGIGVLYPYFKEYVPERNICYGNGVNWLRNYFNLKPYRSDKIKIPIILTEKGVFNTPTAYIVTQVGCPNKCNFCVTNAFLNYTPFCLNSKKIINALEQIRNKSQGDVLLFLCDPNSLFPSKVWEEVFEYFIQNNKGNTIYLFCLISLKHLFHFNLKKIQNKSKLKFLMVNFGLESVLEGGYVKNKDINQNHIKIMNNLGIATFHNFILGLEYHTEKTIDLEIKGNLEYDSAYFSINTLKPLPKTRTYIDLDKENRIFGEDLPPEFLYREGFFPFQHKYLGGGFSALKYAFKAYYECEKKIIDPYSLLIENFSKTPHSESSNILEYITVYFKNISKYNYKYMKLRMPFEFIKTYKENYERAFGTKI